MQTIRHLALLVLVTVAGATESVPSRQPALPIHAVVGGQISWLKLPHAPPLQWRTEIESAPGGWRAITSAEGAGTRLKLETVFGDGTHPSSWTIEAASLEMSSWEPALVGALGQAAAALHFSGQVTISGHGTFQDGAPVGEIVVALKDGRISNPAGGWALDGVTLGGTFAVALSPERLHSTSPLTLTVATISTKRFGARNLMIHGTLEDGWTFAVSGARVEIAGGDMVAAATRVRLAPLQFLTDVTLNRIGLQDVAALVPSAVRSARGRVDGTVQLGWAADGIQIGHGHLVLRNDEPAEVTLRPYPGLLTSWMKGWMRKLPSWLVKWPGPKLVDAEMGRVPIDTKSLDVTFSPEADSEGRTAVIHLVGVPRGAGRTPVNIATNVYGPLKPFIQLGTETDLSFAIGK